MNIFDGQLFQTARTESKILFPILTAFFIQRRLWITNIASLSPFEWLFPKKYRRQIGFLSEPANSFIGTDN